MYTLIYSHISRKKKFRFRGGSLLEYFENVIKKEGLTWIFLNATEESLNFYKKHNYLTSKHSKVYEHTKDF